MIAETMGARRAHGLPARVPAVLVQGMLWGVAASVLDSMVLPVADGSFATLLELFLWTTPGWCLVGIGIAGWIHVAGDRLLHPVFFAASVVGCAVVLSTMRFFAYATVGAVAPAALFPNGIGATASLLYQAWFIVFYGGLFFLAWTLDRRGQRTRRLLSQAGIARERTQALLGEARIRVLRNHVEPELMLRAMGEIERRYSADPAAADRLLGRLVSFLRAAMPGVRAGRTTLRKEIELCQCHARLNADLDDVPVRWQFADCDASANLDFPPLALLSLQTSVIARAPATFRGRVVVSRTTDAVVVSIAGSPPPPAGWLEAREIYRLRVGLASVHRDGFSLHVAQAPAATHPLVTIHIATDDEGEAR